MAYRFDPRGDLPPSTIPSTYQKPCLANGRRDDSAWHAGKSQIENFDGSIPYRTLLRPSTLPTSTKTHQKANTPSPARTCNDWIFSSASNIHVAIDRSAFKTYTSFRSHVLRVADQSPVKVRGIGTVELKIRRQPGSKESHIITLENVLHVPKWICNVFSDVYFEPSSFEHTWTDFGVSFLQKEDGQLKYWGFTEGFLGLERLVLARKVRGRSPMLEDQDREVFSVNLTWPQGQRDIWEAQTAAANAKMEERQQAELARVAKSGLTDLAATNSPAKTMTKGSIDLQNRNGLSDLDANIMYVRPPSVRGSSLKAPTTRSRASSFTERFSFN